MKSTIRKAITGTLAAFPVCRAAMAAPASAQQTHRAIGDDLVLAGTCCPIGTLTPEGQLLSIEQIPDLFAVFGTKYGGDGRVTFALPERRGGYLTYCVVADPVAQQVEQYLGELFSATGQCPQGTFPADGRLLGMNANQAPYSLLRTRYGGDGIQNIALPDLRGEPRTYCVAVRGTHPSWG